MLRFFFECLSEMDLFSISLALSPSLKKWNAPILTVEQLHFSIEWHVRFKATDSQEKKESFFDRARENERGWKRSRRITECNHRSKGAKDTSQSPFFNVPLCKPGISIGF